MTKRPTYSVFKKKALNSPEVREAYDRVAPDYAIRKTLIALRKKAGLTQEELATLLHTKKSNISRLENIETDNSPRLSTLKEYAAAVGYHMKIDFVPAGKN